VSNSTDNSSGADPADESGDEVLELTDEVDGDEGADAAAESSPSGSGATGLEADGGRETGGSRSGSSTPGGVRDTVPEVPEELDEIKDLDDDEETLGEESSGPPAAAVVSTPDAANESSGPGDSEGGTEAEETLRESDVDDEMAADEEPPAVFQTIQMEAIDRQAIEREGQMRQLEETEPLEGSRFAPEIIVQPPRELITEWHDGFGHREEPDQEEEPEADEELRVDGEDDVETRPTDPVGHEAPPSSEAETSPSESDSHADSETETESSPLQGAPSVEDAPSESDFEGDDDEDIPVVEPDEDQVVEELEEVEPEPAGGGDQDGPPNTSMPTPPPEAQQASNKPGGRRGQTESELVENLVDEETPEKKARDDWVKEVFGELYLSTVPTGVQSRTEREADFIEQQMSLESADTILDLACGYGRHTIELAERGHDVVGFDLSKALLKQGLAEAQRRSLEINFFHGDMRSLEFESVFDACYCWQTSFGYFGDRTNLDILARVNRALTSGGELLLEVMNRDYVVKKMPHRIWWEGPECIFLEEGEFDYESSTLHMNRSFIYEDGSRQPVEHDWYIRLYSPHELKELLNQTGFEFVDLSGSIHYPGHFLGHDSAKQIVLAKKRRSVA
jgi:SAM-dependent methyltransferase